MYNGFSNYPSIPSLPLNSGYTGGIPYMPSTAGSLFNFMPSAYHQPSPYMYPGQHAYNHYDRYHQKVVNKSVMYSVILSELLRRVQG